MGRYFQNSKKEGWSCTTNNLPAEVLGTDLPFNIHTNIIMNVHACIHSIYLYESVHFYVCI